MVITLQNIPAEIEEALQRKAAEEGKSLDRVTMDVIVRGLGVDELNLDSLSSTLRHLIGLRTKDLFEEQRRIASIYPGKKRELSSIVGTWVEDPEFESALNEQRQIDPELWH